MKDKAEFQIELDNSTNQKYLANITVNGTSIGPGLILRPGEHTFLDRYTNNKHKFSFSTYEVNRHRKYLGSDNGVVEINFHPQDFNNETSWISPLEFSDNTPTYSTNDTENSETSSTAIINYTSSKTETGTVEKGSKSKQKLEEGSGTFSIWSFKTVTYKILPESQKEVHIREIRSYCTECGRRSKKGWKFCPSCGIKA